MFVLADRTVVIILATFVAVCLLQIIVVYPSIALIAWKNDQLRNYVRSAITATFIPDIALGIYLCSAILQRFLYPQKAIGYLDDASCAVTSYLCLYLVGASMHGRATTFVLNYHHWWMLNIRKVHAITERTKKWWKILAFSLPWVLPLLGMLPSLVGRGQRNVFTIHCMLPPKFSLGSDLISEWLLLALPALPSLIYAHMAIYHWKSCGKGIQGERYVRNHIHMKFAELFSCVGLCNIVGGFLVTLSNSLFNTKCDVILLCLGTSMILLTPISFLIFSPAFKYALCVRFGWIEDTEEGMETRLLGAPVLPGPSPQDPITEFMSAINNPSLVRRITDSLPFNQSRGFLARNSGTPSTLRLLTGSMSISRPSTPLNDNERSGGVMDIEMNEL